MAESGDRPYLHGYSELEHARLVAQSSYWRDKLILPGLDARRGQRLLEIGCASGATLEVIGRGIAGLELAGVDVEARQLEAARAWLDAAGLDGVDLRCADARDLPWADGSFDHVFVMWLLEHLTDPRPVLAEARRVLAPGGRITVIETDYTSFRVHPHDDDYEYLRRAQHDWFARHGNPVIGRQLGPHLVEAGFESVDSHVTGFHFQGGLAEHAAYVADFLEPAVPSMADHLDLDARRLERGLGFLRKLPHHPGASLTQIVFRASGDTPVFS